METTASYSPVGERSFIDNQVLVIDDSKAILLIVKNLLNSLGVSQVTVTHQPVKALDIITRNPNRYSLILTDLNMPEMDGMAVLRGLGELGYQGAVGIISEMESRIVSLAADIAKAYCLHLIGCIAKPLQPKDLNGLLLKAECLFEAQNNPINFLSERQLRDVIAEDFVFPYYQPKINMKTHKVSSVEVLMRVKIRGEQDAVVPNRFLSLAASLDLLDVMTDILIAKAAADMPRLRQQFGDDFRLCINLSPTQLENLSLVDELECRFATYGIPPKQIVLEITEDNALRSPHQLETLNRFRMRGFGVSLDDFGSGFTNINQLRSLPFSEIKIDRSLIINIHRDVFCQTIVNSLIEIASQMDVILVAEGIEQVDELKYLLSHFDEMLIQGYLISKPRSLGSLVAWHASWQKQFAHLTQNN
ncbi:EAL domain-containing protein [Shewanella sp. NIFS-20-20]|uniref:EAL domain-containing response regulator n=1 Tax=Shewanella sp. NIFS-20-20 TaxID=2853806 RepID=UPI001C462D90|nr:EAL domain-containing response regulator [Shewanella sp. NIFS-20-20]MBV7315884.1 EAL domain-containing response regulator [Shewanella sp. NIFS-20-20]